MNIKIVMLVCLLIVGTITAFSQKDNNNNTPGTGYWNIEGNINTPLTHIVKFYNVKNVLIGEKVISGKKLDINKKRIQATLNLMLEGVLLAQEHKRQKNTIVDLAAN